MHGTGQVCILEGRNKKTGLFKLAGHTVPVVTVTSSQNQPVSDLVVDGYLIDTGSRVTMIPREHSNTAKITTEGNFVAANGTPIKTYGTKPITITILSKQYKHTAIVGDVKQPILGLDFFRKGGKDLLIDPSKGKLIRIREAKQCGVYAVRKSPKTKEHYIEEINKLIANRPELTKDPLKNPPALLAPFRIHTGKANPVFSKARPLFGEKKKQVEDVLRSWIGTLLQPVSGEVRWASPIHQVLKKNGEWRVCGDYRRLNAVTEIDKYPLPTLTAFNERMAGCKIFSKIDLKSAYHQVQVAPEDQEKTVINNYIRPF